MEPYWNEVRIQQVIGRARRLKSHALLPPEEHKVYVYRYHMSLTEEQKKIIGEAESTDEAIYRIARAKEVVSNQFLQILKDSAVDCELNSINNVTADNPVVCFKFAENEAGLAFMPAIGEEKLDRAFSAHYKAERLEYADYAHKDHMTEDGRDYRYVYRYAGRPEVVLKENVRLRKRDGTFETTVRMGLVLYSKLLAVNANRLHPTAVIVKVGEREVMLPEGKFQLA